MSRINLLSSGMQGVDLKSNPIIIGAKQKLRFATNMVFEEGVLKSRHGFRYRTLCASGQFQGAVDFQPTRGLSYQPHSVANEGIAVVVRGSLFLNGEKLSGNIYKEKGPVNLFQAENYLVLQNANTETYWWDGETLTKSPGMNEVDFFEIETPVHEMEIVAPVSDITPCITGPNGYTYRFIVIDNSTEETLSNSPYQFFVNDSVSYSGVSGEDGSFSFTPAAGDYKYTAAHTGYHPKELTFLRVEESDHTIYIRLLPIEEVCSIVISDNVVDGEDPTIAQVTFTNNGNVTATLLSIASSVSLSENSLTFPYSLAPAASVAVDVIGVTSLLDASFELTTTCGTYGSPWDGGGSGDACGYLVESIYEDITAAIYRIHNTGDFVLTINSAAVLGGTTFAPTTYAYASELVTLPVDIAPGTYLTVSQLGTEFPTSESAEYSVEMVCDGNIILTSGEIEL